MNKLSVIFVIVALALACLVTASPNATQTKAVSNPKAENGRWQIVNGTPEAARNIMLLDTETGDSWITCNGPEGTGWCMLPRTYIQVGKSSDPKCVRWSENGVCLSYEPPTPPMP